MRTLKFSELSEEIIKKVNKMKEISQKADSRHYLYNVCAMLLDQDGNEYIGVNWEPANGATVCGEVGAISSYLLSERKPIKYVLTYGYPKNSDLRENSFCFPCGSCRQRLIEYIDGDTICYGINEAMTLVKEGTLNELMPYSFNEGNLNN